MQQPVCVWTVLHMVQVCASVQEDPYSGLVGDSWRLPDEKDQFRLELQRMVKVLRRLCFVVARAESVTRIATVPATCALCNLLQRTPACASACCVNTAEQGFEASSHLLVQGHIHFPSIILWTLFNEVQTPNSPCQILPTHHSKSLTSYDHNGTIISTTCV